MNFMVGIHVCCFISSGNHMVLSSICDLFAQVSFSKSLHCTSHFGRCNLSFLKNLQVQINHSLNKKTK